MPARVGPYWNGTALAAAAWVLLTSAVGRAQPAPLAAPSPAGPLLGAAEGPCLSPWTWPSTSAPPLAQPGAPSEGTTTPSPGGTPEGTTGGPPAGDTAGGAGGSSFDVAGLGAAGGSAVGGGSFTGAGYVDPAIPVTQYRLRVDAGHDDNRPDRADFFYNTRTLPPTFPQVDHINFQQLSNYLEWAPARQFSLWVDIPVRWVDFFFLNPAAGHLTHQGLSDVQFGFKYAFLYDPSQILTFQLRNYTPTGDPTTGLGRGNWNVEPALLYYRRLTSRLFFEGELQDFTPVAAHDAFAGNVFNYGGSLSFLLYNRPTFRVVPVTELVGWHVFSGKETAGNGVVLSAAGDNIVNAKFGVRVGLGELVQPGLLNRADLYVGYGRALTGAVWYKDIVRAEFRLRF